MRKLWSLCLVLAVLGLVGVGTSGTASASSPTQIADCSFATLKADLEAGGDYYYNAGQCPDPIHFDGTITISGHAGLIAYGVVFDGGGTVQLLVVNDGASLDLRGVTLSSGSAMPATYGGGAIENLGTVTVTDSTFAHNNDGNRPDYGGGAILNGPGASLTITSSTFTDNWDVSFTATPGGGAIFNFAGTVDISNSTPRSARWPGPDVRRSQTDR